MPISVFDPSDDYCFVMMPFDQSFDHIYGEAIAPAVTDTGLHVVRADEISNLGIITEEIRKHIKAAKIIIADLTNQNANVFYELGMAHAHEKQVIMLTQRNDDVPFDIKHIKYFKYLPSPQGLIDLKNQLRELIASVCFPPKPALDMMLAPENEDDVYLLYGAVLSKVGIANLTPAGIKAKQNDLLGLDILTTGLRRIFSERLHVRDANTITEDDDLFKSGHNIILTGGPKANPWYEFYVKKIQVDRSPQWGFAPIHRDNLGAPWRMTYNGEIWPQTEEVGKDYALILRSPMSDDSSSLITVLVGLGSPGQVAANIAATDSFLINEIDKKLDRRLSNKKMPIWILVSCYAEDFKLKRETIKIENAGVFK